MIAAMKASIFPCAIVLTVALGALNAVYADSATWNLNPTSGDWTTAGNWTPATVPNGPSDTATFASSTITGVSDSLNTEVNGIVFNAGASAFTITITTTPTFSPTFTISGVGITNNSGIMQNIVTMGDPVNGPQAFIAFTNSATAGSLTVFAINDRCRIDF